MAGEPPRALASRGGVFEREIARGARAALQPQLQQVVAPAAAEFDDRVGAVGERNQLLEQEPRTAVQREAARQLQALPGHDDRLQPLLRARDLEAPDPVDDACEVALSRA